MVQALLAAYRLPSAALQWSYLPDTVRAAQAPVPAKAATAMDDYLQQANETSSIGLRLAHDLGHARVYPIDDHTSKDGLAAIWQRVQNVFSDSLLASIRNAPHEQTADSLLQRGIARGTLLPYYRYVNSEAYNQANVASQWGAFLRPPVPASLGRRRVALWETRNLNIAAHIRRATAQHTDARVLVIVGSSHKPFLEDYLRPMTGIEVVPFSEVLGTAK